jgi:hypothetical protein
MVKVIGGTNRRKTRSGYRQKVLNKLWKDFTRKFRRNRKIYIEDDPVIMEADVLQIQNATRSKSRSKSKSKSQKSVKTPRAISVSIRSSPAYAEPVSRARVVESQSHFFGRRRHIVRSEEEQHLIKH